MKRRRIEDKFHTLIKLLAVGAIVAAFALMTNIALSKPIAHTIHGRIFFNLYTLPDIIDKANDKEVILDINSLGGLVDSAIFFMDYMRFKQGLGTTFKCIVTDKAASAAFFILTNCDTRYAKANVRLLWHYIVVNLEGGYNKQDLQDIINGWYDAADIYFQKYTIEALGITEGFYTKHAKNNTWFTAAQIKEISPDFIYILEDK
jgi:ATP-dependent protease ClpP protease subunit